VRLLHDGPETFDEMLEVIHAAQRSVALESYILRTDELGHRFADALIAAAARGVSSRVITDWIGARGTSRKFLNSMRKHGIDVRVYNPPGLRAWLGLVPRDHR
jgi:cardiolipin synthase